MGGTQAAKVFLQIEKASLKKQGVLTEAERPSDTITQRYDEQTEPACAVRDLGDAIIDPTHSVMISWALKLQRGAHRAASRPGS